MSFNRLSWQSKPRYRHQNRFSKWYSSKTIEYLIFLQLCFYELGTYATHLCPKRPRYLPFPGSLGVIPARKFKIVTRIGRHIGFMLIRSGHT